METIFLSHPHTLKKEDIKPTVMALGFFDGVHLGHQKVIKKAIELAHQNNCQSAVMTFNPHPKEILRMGEKINYLSPLPQKINLISNLGVDVLYIVDFTKEFANLTPQQFVDDYLIGLHVIHVVAGFDYTYGKLGKGTMETLPFHSRKSFVQTTIAKVEKKSEKISSTSIRTKLSNGEVSLIPPLLGKYYEVEGTVVHGEKRGRQIGFPTANIETGRFLLPATGVYAVIAKVNDQTFEGVCNIGYKPTFQGKKQTVEVHLFHFKGDIYDAKMTIKWIERIRCEQKFSSIEELTDQIHQDKQKAEQILEKINLCSCNL